MSTTNALDYTVIDKESLNRDFRNLNFPPVLLIDTISFCTLKCSMCPHRFLKRKKGKMEWTLYKKIINEISEKNKNSRVWITFAGEGTMLKDLPEKIAYAKAQGLQDIVLNSNGTLLTENFAERLVKSGLDTLMVGVDAFTDTTYRKLRVGGILEKTVANVLGYKKALEKWGKPNQSLNVQFVQMPENEKELDDFVIFWNEKDIEVKIKPMVSWINRIEASNLLYNVERLPCYWLCKVMAITDTGQTALCGADLDCSMPMGDVSKSSIEEIWNGKLKLMREIHLKGEWNKLPKICTTCKDWQSGYAKYAKK